MSHTNETWAPLRDDAGRATVISSEISSADTGRIILGIDPGLNGALAFYNTAEGTLVVCDMPTVELVRNRKTKREVDPVQVAALIRKHHPDQAVLELVNSTPQMGVSSAFTFGEGKGVLRGALAALNVPTTPVPPQTWQRDMRVRKGKDAARARAAEMFPSYAHYFARVKDDGRADAALIAGWGARIV